MNHVLLQQEAVAIDNNLSSGGPINNNYHMYPQSFPMILDPAHHHSGNFNQPVATVGKLIDWLSGHHLMYQDWDLKLILSASIFCWKGMVSSIDERGICSHQRHESVSKLTTQKGTSEVSNHLTVVVDVQSSTYGLWLKWYRERTMPSLHLSEVRWTIIRHCTWCIRAPLSYDCYGLLLHTECWWEANSNNLQREDCTREVSSISNPWVRKYTVSNNLERTDRSEDEA